MHLWRYIDLKFFVSISHSMWPLGVKEEGGGKKFSLTFVYIFIPLNYFPRIQVPKTFVFKHFLCFLFLPHFLTILPSNVAIFH